MRLPIGMDEAIMICADAYPAASDLIPEQVADDYVEQRERMRTALVRPAWWDDDIRRG